MINSVKYMILNILVPSKYTLANVSSPGVRRDACSVYTTGR